MKYHRVYLQRSIKVEKITQGQELRCIQFKDRFTEPFQRSGLLPTFNPYDGVLFNIGKRRSDAYKDLFHGRGFITSPKLTAILKESALPGHVFFDNINCLSGSEQVNNYSYLNIYESSLDSIDFDRSLFVLTDADDRSYIGNIVDGVHKFKVIEDEIRVKDFHELEQLERVMMKKNRTLLQPSVLCLPKHIDHDIVTMYYYTTNFYLLSDRLVNKLKKSRIKGFDYVYPHFRIGCA